VKRKGLKILGLSHRKKRGSQGDTDSHYNKRLTQI
jgi:hypothetical protein